MGRVAHDRSRLMDRFVVSDQPRRAAPAPTHIRPLGPRPGARRGESI